MPQILRNIVFRGSNSPWRGATGTEYGEPETSTPLSLLNRYSLSDYRRLDCLGPGGDSFSASHKSFLRSILIFPSLHRSTVRLSQSYGRFEALANALSDTVLCGAKCHVCFSPCYSHNQTPSRFLTRRPLPLTRGQYSGAEPKI